MPGLGALRRLTLTCDSPAPENHDHTKDHRSYGHGHHATGENCNILSHLVTDPTGNFASRIPLGIPTLFALPVPARVVADSSEAVTRPVNPCASLCKLVQACASLCKLVQACASLCKLVQACASVMWAHIRFGRDDVKRSTKISVAEYLGYFFSSIFGLLLSQHTYGVATAADGASQKGVSTPRFGRARAGSMF